MTGREDQLSKMAEILGKHPVIVRIRLPITEGVKAETSRLEYHAVIDLSPELRGETLFFAFLHECAHVKLHWNRMQITRDAFLPEASVSYQAAVRYGEISHPGNQKETEADQLAHQWQKRPEIRDLFNTILSISDLERGEL